MNNDTGSISSLKNEVKRLKETVSSMMGDTRPLYKELEFQKGKLNTRYEQKVDNLRSLVRTITNYVLYGVTTVSSHVAQVKLSCCWQRERGTQHRMRMVCRDDVFEICVRIFDAYKVVFDVLFLLRKQQLLLCASICVRIAYLMCCFCCESFCCCCCCINLLLLALISYKVVFERRLNDIASHR